MHTALYAPEEKRIMGKANRPGSQKAADNDTATDKQETQPADTSTSPATMEQKKTSKQSGKSRQSAIGGTAVPGAKSTQPKELSTASPANQQAEYYNREMRRRMQQMGTGPYSDRAALDPRERRRKRLKKLKERQEKIKRLVDEKGPSREIKLGRRNTYFLVGTIVLIVLLVVLFILIRRPF
jgi:cobalamin biosynthesis Mg chelatase CobN